LSLALFPPPPCRFKHSPQTSDAQGRTGQCIREPGQRFGQVVLPLGVRGLVGGQLPAEFHAAFRTACESVGLGEPFWSPIVAHAEINDAGEHGSISARLLAEVDVVSREEVLVVKKQVVTMLESMVEFERAVLDPRNEIAR